MIIDSSLDFRKFKTDKNKFEILEEILRTGIQDEPKKIFPLGWM